MRVALVLAAVAALVAAPAHAGAVSHEGPLAVVAAENFYGDLARQIGGAHVIVTSILSNPDEDPHLFETSPATARAIAGADVVLYNGAEYDPWMQKLLAASPNALRPAIVAADLVGAKSGDNPHLWYKPATMPKVAKALADTLARRDPGNAAAYKANLERFDASFKPINAAIAAIRARHGGLTVTATEPVFGYMAVALGFTMLNGDFQLAVMNNAEPSPSQVAAFEDSIRDGRVKILFYNKQVTDKTTERLLAIANASHVKVIGVTETEPKGLGVQAWYEGQLKAIASALDEKPM